MPSLSGLDILKQLDAANYPAPICIVSGGGDIPLAVEAIRRGAYDFMEKQMDAGSIVERVEKRSKPGHAGKKRMSLPKSDGIPFPAATA